MRAAEQLGAQTVVVHPPFRWQRRYAEGFADQVAELEASSDVMVAVENMFPFRTDRFFGAGQPSIERMRKRGGSPGRGISAFAPSYDPLDGDHAHYTLDLSHTATAGTDAVEMAERMGEGLVHLHLCDGSGASTDEHLVPGRGTQPDRRDLPDAGGQRLLRPRDPRGDDVRARTPPSVRQLLTESLEFARDTSAALRSGRLMSCESTLFTDAMALTAVSSATRR